MEWLINRRRMMYVKLAPPEYMAFEDPYVADLCAYFWGDTETLGNGDVLKTGALVGNGDNDVISNPIFANNVYIPAHKAGNTKTITAKNRRTVGYRLYLSITGVSGTDIWDAETISDTSSKVFNVASLNTGTTTWSSLKSVTKGNWSAEKTTPTVLNYDSTSGKYYVDFTAPDTCRYIQITVKADSNIQISWSLEIANGTVYKPIGVTLKQCAAVNNDLFGGANNAYFNRLAYNPYITKFNEFQYFTNIIEAGGTNYGSCGFTRDTNLIEIILPNTMLNIGKLFFKDCSSLQHLDFKNVKVIGYMGIALSGLQEIVLNEGFTTIENNNNLGQTYIDFPSTTTNIGNLTFSQNDYQINVCRATTPPTLPSGAITRMKRLYVPQASLEVYKTADIWSNVASKTFAIEGTWYETHRSLDPNEPA